MPCAGSSGVRFTGRRSALTWPRIYDGFARELSKVFVHPSRMRIDVGDDHSNDLDLRHTSRDANARTKLAKYDAVHQPQAIASVVWIAHRVEDEVALASSDGGSTAFRSGIGTVPVLSVRRRGEQDKRYSKY